MCVAERARERESGGVCVCVMREEHRESDSSVFGCGVCVWCEERGERDEMREERERGERREREREIECVGVCVCV